MKSLSRSAQVDALADGRHHSLAVPKTGSVQIGEVSLGESSILRLKFDDVDLESRWRRQNFERSLSQVRIALVVAAVVLLAYQLADKYILPPDLADLDLLAPRAMTTSAAIVVFVISLTSMFERIWQGCLIIAVVTVMAGLAWMWLIVAADEGTFHASIYWYYHNGVVLIAMYSFLLLRLTMTSALIISGSQIALFLLVAAIQPEQEVVNLVAGASIAFILLIGLVAVYGLETTERRVFRQRALIDRQRKDLASSLRDLKAEKQKTEEQARMLLELDVAKNRFFQNISHEFRTPLTLIVGPLQDAIEGFLDRDPEAFRKQLAGMLQSARRLLQLVNQMLDLSKLEAGRFELNMQPADLVSIARLASQSFVPMAERRRIDFRFESDCQSLPCLCDEDTIERVVLNLVSNALKFTPREGEVSVRLSAQTEDDHVTAKLTVTDTGPGISPEDIDRIFDRFHQADMSGERRFEGTGIGLSLAKELVELHGGSIRVDSKIGSGTSFEASIPITLVPENIVPKIGRDDPDHFGVIELPTGVSANGEPADAGGATILVVDDNLEVREYIGSHLGGHYHLLEAENGQEGLEMAKAYVPDLILSDIMMPEMDGYEMVRRIREIESLQDVPVIMLTAKAAETDVVEGMESGADEYLVKPFGAKELAARVAGLIGRHKQLRERFSQEVVVRPFDIVVKPADAAFLETMISIINARLGDPAFGVDWLADEVGLSRRQLERKLGAILDESPAMVIRRFRMERASQLLRAGSGTVAEVAYAVGFSSPDYFAKVFRSTHGELPSEHARRDA